MFWTCGPEWEGEAAFIVAGGPSVKQQNLELLRGRRVIVINSSVHVLPWADMLFFGDGRWWRADENMMAAESFGGIAVTTSRQVNSKFIHVMRKTAPPGLAIDRQSLMVKRTSLTGAINLAVHRGAKQIVLLGADGKRAQDGNTHHHKPHRWPTRPGCWDVQKSDIQSLVGPLNDRGIAVYNASPGSAWTMWPVMTLEQALECVGNMEAAR